MEYYKNFLWIYGTWSKKSGPSTLSATTTPKDECLGRRRVLIPTAIGSRRDRDRGVATRAGNH